MYVIHHLSDGGCLSCRMKSLEQDALKAQMVIAKSRDGKKRGTLDQLTESPSPAPTPSPTPMEGTKLLSFKKKKRKFKIQIEAKASDICFYLPRSFYPTPYSLFVLQQSWVLADWHLQAGW